MSAYLRPLLELFVFAGFIGALGTAAIVIADRQAVHVAEAR